MGAEFSPDRSRVATRLRAHRAPRPTLDFAASALALRCAATQRAFRASIMRGRAETEGAGTLDRPMTLAPPATDNMRRPCSDQLMPETLEGPGTRRAPAVRGPAPSDGGIENGSQP